MTTETDGTPVAPLTAHEGPDDPGSAPGVEPTIDHPDLAEDVEHPDRADETALDGIERDVAAGAERGDEQPSGDEARGAAEGSREAVAEVIATQKGSTADADSVRGGPPAKSARKVALEAEGDVAADFLEALLDICDIDGDIDVDIDGDRAAVSIVDSDEGRVPRRLVGPDGKVLEALQELTRLAVQSETGERSRLMLDVAGHRAARRAEIVEVARAVIEDVRNSGDQIEMQPMTAFERKIVHDEVLAAGLRSESDGVEPRRFVVVLPAS